MKRHLFARILSVLLMISLLLTEAGPTLAYALEPSAPEAQTETGENAVDEEGSEEPETLPEESAGGDETTDAEDSDASAESDPQDQPDAQQPEQGEENAPDGSQDGDDQATPEEGEPSEQPDTSTPDEAGEDVTEEQPASEAEQEDLTEDGEIPQEELLTPEQEAEQAAMAQAEQELWMVLSRRAGYAQYDYATELAKFPASYQSYLKTLHTAHPNWTFVAVDTGLDWDDVIEGELGEQSTLDYTYSDLLLNNHSGYYSPSSYPNTNGYKPIDSGHVSCSRAAIAYYMDPRNFLMDKYIFQFEDQEFNLNVQQLSGVQKILKNACSTSTGLYNIRTYVTTSGNQASLSSLNSAYGSDYSTIIYNVGRTVGISPYFLASKIAQETGANTTNGSISGTYSGYTGYYNFYNIGAYASANGGAIAKGLAYAKSKGWSNPILAIKGGAEYIYNQYIGKGQNTIYYMRFNVSPEASYDLYTHQYMSATYAVAGEATKTYNAYQEVGAVDNDFLFFIPVYRNMPDKTAKVSLTPTTTGKTNVSCGLYAGPSTSTAKQVQVPAGASVTVLSGSVTTTDNYTSRLVHPYWYQVTVTVSGKSYTGYLDEENVDLSATYNIKRGTTYNLKSVLSTSGNTGTLYYETSDPTIATVSDSGVITAKSNGTCSIYVISGGGSFDAVGVTVSNTGSDNNPTGGLPAVPDMISAENRNGSVVVTWEKISNATAYALYRKTTGGWVRIANITSGSTVTYTDTNVTNNTVYTYTVRAVNSYGASDYDHAGVQTRYLSTPKLTSAKAYSDGIAVQWNSISGATGYTFYRKSGSGSWQVLANLTASSGSVQGYTDGTAKKGTTYTYTVRATYGSQRSYFVTSGISATAATTQPVIPAVACGQLYYRTGAGLSYDAAGSYASGALVQVVLGGTVNVSGTTWYRVRVNGGGTLYYVSGSYLLLTPTLGTVTNSTKGVELTWDDQPKATGYYVYRRIGTSDWVRLSGVVTNQYCDTTAQSGTVYTYTVRAASGSFVSDYDRSGISIRYLSTPVLTSAKASDDSIQVSWGKVTGTASYAVYRKTASTGWKLQSMTTTTSFTDKNGLEPGQTYYYTVRAYHTGTLSSFDTAGVKATMPENLEDQVARGKISYYASAGGSSASGTLAAGTIVQVVSGWSQTIGGTPWLKLKISGKYYYTQASNLLDTPELAQAYSIIGAVRVKWNAISNGDGYAVYRRTPGGSWGRIATLTSSSTTYFDDKTAVSGQTYEYTVRASYGSALSRYDTSGIACLYLTTPTLNTPTSSSTGITLSWSKVTGADSYAVYRKASADASWKLLAMSESTSYTDQKDLVKGTTYYYTVRAYTNGNLSSYNTAGVMATYAEILESQVAREQISYYASVGDTKASGTLTAGTVVQVVSGWTQTENGTAWLRLKRNGSYYYTPASNLLGTPELTDAYSIVGAVRVWWDQISSAKGYAIYRRVPGGPWGLLGTRSSNSITYYDDKTAVSGERYEYTVRAMYGSILSQFDTAGISCLYLATPTLNSAKASTSGIALSWSKITGADSYAIYRKASASAGWKLLTMSTATSYTDKSGLEAGTTYYYTVRAYTDGNLSSYNTAGISAKAVASSITLVNYVTTGMLNYRSSPDKTTSSNIVGTLDSGVTVKVVSGWSQTVDDTTWFKCYLNGNYYYLSSKYLKPA